ncbi:hypothetical protein ACJJTC_007953, partial [Scirpophaga incertulas]
MNGEPDVLADTFTKTTQSDTFSDLHQAKKDSLEKKVIHLRHVLEKDFKAADLKWSLFVAAAFSFRYESCLKPFPPAFIKNGIKDMDKLLSVIADVPALDLLLHQFNNLDNLSHLSEIIDLLFYVLVRLKEPTLKSINQETNKSVLRNISEDTLKPQYLFQINYSSKSTLEARWREMAQNHNTFFAFHINCLENFYSIINFGFQQHLNKKTIVGTGIYFSTDVSLPYSLGGFGWGASCIGGHISCIALCEIIDAPEGINYQRRIYKEGDGTYENEHGTRLKETGIEKKISQYIITNPDLVRLKYLLIYAKQTSSMRFPIMSSNDRQ